MSAEASIPTPPLPGKDPPLQISSTSPNPAPISPSLLPPSDLPSPRLPFSASRSMPPPLRPKINTTGDLQTSDLPPTPLLPRPNFTPFFTLINDSTTQSTHHPSRIHYIFSDDDESEVLTAACVRSLQSQIEEESPAASRELGGSEQGTRESETSSSSSVTFRKGGESKREKGGKGKAPLKREERVIIVDINESGDGIVCTNSLSSGWQIVSADVANAPTFNNDSAAGDTGAEEGERGLMLRIEGVGICGEKGDEMGDSGEKRKVGGESGVMGEEEMQALLDGFDRKMGVLRKIVASGESWDEARKEKVTGDCDSGKED